MGIRIISFRGQRVDSVEWVYGYYVKSVNDKSYIIIACTEDDVTTKNEVDFIYIEVKPETLGQFTGLKDKEGTKIFEGDIVDTASGEKWKVDWFMDYASFSLLDTEGARHALQFNLVCKVIGNKTDNPNLLEESK